MGWRLLQRSGGLHYDARGLAGCRHTPCEYGVDRVEVVVAGTIIAVVEAVNVWQALAILLVGGLWAALFASWPIAPGRGREAFGDVAESAPCIGGSC